MNPCSMLLFPLIGFLISGAASFFGVKGKSETRSIVFGSIASLAMLVSFGFAVAGFLQLQGMGEHAHIEEVLFSWIHVGALNLDFALRLDPLSALFCLVITGVGSLIHLYSIGYMSHDAAPEKFFAYLNLFCAFMLVLVLGSSLPVVFLGWEGVGLCSYLLIGFWSDSVQNTDAGKKAFIMNRIGDVGFILATLLAINVLGTVDLLKMNEAVGAAEPTAITALGFLLFFACTGKSAQFPLFTWLPDAMAGPTPVSALIHAATMVTSGIYLLARLHTVIAFSPLVLLVISVVGMFTAFVAATSALAQSDIKKILAYSTVSQLGLMFAACGAGAFSSGVFHVVTHAFFKALLFLGAGSVIHALHEEQNIFKMGGLKSKLPITWGVFVVAWAAIIGLPPFSGFFSKDELLFKILSESPFSQPVSYALWICGVAIAFLTSFYMTRLMVLTFLGTSRLPKEKEQKVHESPAIMWVPLVVLAILSAVGGWIGLPHISWIGHWLHDFNFETEPTLSDTVEYVLMGLNVVVALVAAKLAHNKYSKLKGTESSSVFLGKAWGFDSFAMGPFKSLFKGAAKISDNFLENQIVGRLNQVGVTAVEVSGNALRVLGSGSLQGYVGFTVFIMSLFLGVYLYAGIR